ncbi:MAG TPA: transglycosylase domain-containing protein [Micromonosporaceae bacterium]
MPESKDDPTGTKPAQPGAAADRSPLTGASDGLFHRIRTGEWPVLKIDLSEAYANVRRRATRLRRRRIISGVLAGIVLAGLATVVGTYYASAIPLPSQLALPETTTVYYSDGTTVMARLGSQRRTIVPAASLPPYVEKAVIAAEDPQYWVTSGTLITRQYARAATIATGGSVQGPTAEARMLVLAWKLEDTYSKEQILEFYLNTVYFGRGSYGIEEAARAYFGVGAAQLSLPQAIVLAGMIASPGDGRYDPTVDLVSAGTRFAIVAQAMVGMGELDQDTASHLTLPTVQPYQPDDSDSALDTPVGFIVAQVLAELRDSDPFRGRSASYLVDGGFSIVTTIDARVQALLEQTVDETVPGSLLAPQPPNVRAAAVVVQPGTGRVVAYYGGHNGTGADYAGTRTSADGGVSGFGFHPPAQTMTVYTLAAALEAGISARSRWQSPTIKPFPKSGHTATDPVRDVNTAPCQPVCTLTQAATVPLSIPFYSVVDRIGAGAVIDAAKAAGIGAMWTPGEAPVRYDLTTQAGAALSPEPFNEDVALGSYPVTVLDQASAMATLAAGGLRAPTHFVSRVVKDYVVYQQESTRTVPALDPRVVADVTAVLAQHDSAGLAPDGPVSASISGTALLPDSARDTVHAWHVGFTPALAVAVWVGNQEVELPLRDAAGNRITGDTLPADVFRAVVTGATGLLDPPAAQFPPPANLGDPNAGDAAAPRAGAVR